MFTQYEPTLILDPAPFAQLTPDQMAEMRQLAKSLFPGAQKITLVPLDNSEPMAMRWSSDLSAFMHLWFRALPYARAKGTLTTPKTVKFTVGFPTFSGSARVAASLMAFDRADSVTTMVPLTSEILVPYPTTSVTPGILTTSLPVVVQSMALHGDPANSSQITVRSQDISGLSSATLGYDPRPGAVVSRADRLRLRTAIVTF